MNSTHRLDDPRRLLTETLSVPNARPVFITGAGISIASGIAPFRGTPDAVWEKDITEKGTFDYFLCHPVEAWQWLLGALAGAAGAKPNPAHLALTCLEEKLGDRMTLITQNVDGLHLVAGSRRCLEVHGNMRHMRCVDRFCSSGFGGTRGLLPWDEVQVSRFLANPCRETLPRCPCGKILRAHVLWFDESYDGHEDYQFVQAIKAFNKMTALIFIGTSFAVGFTELAKLAGYQYRVPMFVIDPHDSLRFPGLHIQAAAEDFLPHLAAAVEVG
jgi:NAD-dependent deacetylase